MERKNSESLQHQREKIERRKRESINKIDNHKEKINVCLDEDFNNFKEKEFEKQQIKNVYINTFYFFILSILFGLVYLFITINKY